MTKTVLTHNVEETEKLGQTLGQALRGGEVIELTSDLGGGKTTFTRGIAVGAGSNDHVSSPTFTISNIYKAPKFTINHFDFYRLPSAGLIEHELEDVLGQNDQVILVEWSDVVAHVLPEDRLTVTITNNGEDERSFTLDYPKKLEYLVDSL